MKFGPHVSIAGGLPNGPLNAQEVGAETFQIFSRSPRGGKAPEITKELLADFKKNLKDANIESFYIHAPYYINLASATPRIADSSIQILKDELKRGSTLGANGMMFHIGSAKDFGKEKSTKIVIKAINEILKDYKGTTKFLIENSAGAGEIIGATFEEIGEIIKKVKNKKHIGVCLDTCHMFASGYDFRDAKSLNKTVKDFDKHIGLEYLQVIHLNDSLKEYNSKRDRHADIGFGLIGKKAFELLVNHPKLNHLDAVLETPQKEIVYEKAIKKLIKMDLGHNK